MKDFLTLFKAKQNGWILYTYYIAVPRFICLVYKATYAFDISPPSKRINLVPNLN